MTRRPRALVIGGSLGGPFAANVLREVCGWDVEVFERVENDLAARGSFYDELANLGSPQQRPDSGSRKDS